MGSSSEMVRRVECGCCGMWEDCTLGYIACVEERFGGHWVCGLCAEAIKEEQSRLGLGVEAALEVHARFRGETNSTDPTIHIARSILHLLKKIISSSSSSSTTTKPAANFSFPAKTTQCKR